jgi:hypothetical protein
MAESTALTTAVKAPPTAAGFGLLMSPQSIAEVRALCESFAKTDFVPKAFRGKPDAIMVVGAMGARLGVDVFAAMAGIADINGKPAIYGDLMLAVVLNHPACEDVQETFEGKPYEDTFRAICTVKRKGKAPTVRSFSVTEAKEAALWKKAGPWTNTPQRMLQMRARSFALRDSFADALAGFHSREEMEDAQEAEVLAVRTEPAPARTAAPAATENGGPAQPGTEQPGGGAPTGSSASAGGQSPAAGSPPAKPPHPAIAAARDLYAKANGMLKGTGAKVMARACALHGADKPQGIPADQLDAFGRTIEALAKAADYDALMEKLASLEVDAAEAAREAAAGGGK